MAHRVLRFSLLTSCHLYVCVLYCLSLVPKIGTTNCSKREFETFLTQNKTKGDIHMKNQKALFLTQGAAIAALYVILTLLANALGLSSYVIQVRFSEALTILPFFTSAAIPGLFVGCILSNFLTGGLLLDVIFGSLATLLGALGTYTLRRHPRLAPLPPIISNVLIVPWVLAYVYHFEGSIPYFMLTVGLGEVISCGVLGTILLHVLQKYRRYLQ